MLSVRIYGSFVEADALSGELARGGADALVGVAVGVEACADDSNSDGLSDAVSAYGRPPSVIPVTSNS